MEAASARMASRGQYQFDGFSPPRSTLQRFIYNACDPIANLEPNLALNLEIVDLINSKKGNAPREAAVTIVQLINHRNPNVSLLALSLLDNCVKNCGYPFQLQISTKEFLNELVRRFPERPPLRPSRVQSKILEAIEEWRQTICQTSRYKEDLGYIRDMHRLLLYKGYMFPEIRSEDAAVLNPSDNLQSAEEMEEEERAAQSAKLQELIRRGRPQDLQEANRLMKVMAGYDTRHKTDYRAKAAEEVAKVQQKARILEDMLQSHKEGDKIGDGDVFEELVSALQSAHPKIQKMCEEESDDAEAVAKLLEINDSIHRTIERYKLMKAGNVEAANKIAKGTLGTTTGVGKNAANELSLIDFDPEPTGAPAESSANGSLSLLDEGTATQSTPSQHRTVEDDLLGLSIGDNGSGSGTVGAISLGSNNNTTFTAPSGSIFGNPSSPPPSQSAFPQALSKANYDAFASLNSASPMSKPTTPAPPVQQQRAQSQVSVDPFASLISSSSRPATPSKQANTLQAKSQPLAAMSKPSTAPAGAQGDDEWTFESSLPETSTVKVLSSDVEIEFEPRRPAGASYILITARFSNMTNSHITNLHFQVAVEKSYSLQLKPQTGREMSPKARNAIQQEVLLNGVSPGKGNVVKMRFKVSYELKGQAQEQQGTVPSLGIS
ncbi:VHS domain-containing protein [Exophiala viscosa]|uniref:VHS domain-containing protein n=1 Tax=Exophiala viscosa TaxID=2486360 RepID=A0AAN6I8Y7_9EURO|nr:VHS domain-containing protein [Exophiala viscosa]